MKRTLSFLLGVFVLAALWWGPLPGMTRQSFAAHMALHTGVVAVVAPLLALGMAGGRFDPVRRIPAWLPAIPLSILELVVVWVWHAPVLHHAARHSAIVFAGEQASFLMCGWLVWQASLGGEPVRQSERTGAGIAALLLTAMHMTLLGALLALTPRVLYAHEVHDGEGALAPLEDQHLGGAIMLLVGGVSYLAGGLGLTTRLVRHKRSIGEVRA